MELEVLPPPPPRSPSSSAPTNHAWDLERTIDDVVFLSFFVGNDFLPHLPAMDIGDEGLDFLLAAYCEERHKWIDDHKINASFSEKDANDGPYLTRAGRIVSASRLEGFLSVLGSHERNYHAYKRSTVNLDRQRKYEAKFDQILRTPSDDVLHAKEQDDRKRYREMLEVASKRSSSATGGATPLVMPGLAPSDDDSRNAPSHEFFEPVVSNVQSFSERMSCLLKLSVATSGGARGCEAAPAGESGTTNRIESPRSDVDDQDIKGRYYFEKFGFSPFDADKHLALRKAYLEGLVWNLQYYYQGCVSWEWCVVLGVASAVT
jgi:5'-3' exoribonuclease 2